MATPQALSAVIRAARPEYRSAADRVVFAVHAVLSVNGFSLRKVGDGVDEAVGRGASALPSEEADLTGWNAQQDMYSFLYVPDEHHQPQQPAPQQQAAPPPLLLLKALPLGAQLLLLSLVDAASDRPPVTLELPLDRYVPPAAAPAAPAAMPAQLEELIARVQGALEEVLQQGGAAPPKATAGAASTAAASAAAAGGSGRGAPAQPGPAGQGQGRRGDEGSERRDPLLDERYHPGGRLGPMRGPPEWGPGGIGDDDLMPGGLPGPPGLGMPGGLGGGVPLGPRGMGGGMHVGPENPIFAGRLRHPRPPGMGAPGPGGGPGGGVPGMRWDPINPEGLQGWAPEDFTRDGSAVRREGINDIGPPPGRATDWDNMFG